MAYEKSNALNFEILSWDTIRTSLKANVQSKRTQPTDHWLQLLDERVARSQRELTPTTALTNEYMQWVRSRTSYIKAASKAIPSSILGDGSFLSMTFLNMNFQGRMPSKVN